MRIDKIKEMVRDNNLDMLILTELTNIRYLVGYSGSSGLLAVTPDDAYFATDFRYKSQIEREVRGAKKYIIEKTLLDLFDMAGALKGASRIGFEREHISYAVFQKLKDTFPEAEFVETKMWVEDILMVKEPDEIEKIGQASRIAEQALESCRPYLKPGITELEFAAELEYRMKKLGSEYPAFTTIVASGPNAALPHAHASRREFQTGDLVVVDYGAIYEGYCCDITRTFALGDIQPELQDIYEIVKEANQLAIDRAQAGMAAQDLDKIARDYITQKGYGDYFGHSLGHGIGLLVHDYPRVSSRDSTILKEGMVVTIEPGIYLPDKGGVRIEDDVVIHDQGCEVITRLPKTLESMRIPV
ncbi:aminopeptidase P family protein [bacterium]|nr:aminopeptidase P family protein [bacterium]